MSDYDHLPAHKRPGYAERMRESADMRRKEWKEDAALATVTICWNCNHPYPITASNCPDCCATNANVDHDKAMKEMQGFGL